MHHATATTSGLAIASLLLDHRASLTAEDSDGWQPLHGAAFFGHVDVLELMVKHKANVDSADKQGVQPLHLAAKAGAAGVVEALARHGANVSAADYQGQLPENYAADPTVLELLARLSAQQSSSPWLGVLCGVVLLQAVLLAAWVIRRLGNPNLDKSGKAKKSKKKAH